MNFAVSKEMNFLPYNTEQMKHTRQHHPLLAEPGQIVSSVGTFPITWAISRHSDLGDPFLSQESALDTVCLLQNYQIHFSNYLRESILTTLPSILYPI